MGKQRFRSGSAFYVAIRIEVERGKSKSPRSGVLTLQLRLNIECVGLYQAL